MRLRSRVVECGIADGHPADIPCRDAATRRVAFHCPRCGQRQRVVCTFHETVIGRGLGACEVCDLAGDLVAVTFLQSGPADGESVFPTRQDAATDPTRMEALSCPSSSPPGS